MQTVTAVIAAAIAALAIGILSFGLTYRVEWKPSGYMIQIESN
jgi:hypothetical protein